MAAPQNNTDLFDLYFRRADLDHDGRISGQEAVTFFQGANLPKNVLAQIWAHADQSQKGSLGRPEFYNALKLVTVAQSKRELTPDIVKAALFGPAAAKIPAPQINLAAIPSPATSAPQMGPAGPTAGFRGPQVPQNMNMNPQYFQPQSNQFNRPPQTMAGGVGSVPPQTMAAGVGSVPPQNIATQTLMRGGSMGPPRPPPSNVSTDWLGTRAGGTPGSAPPQVSNRGITPPMALDVFGLGSTGVTSSLPPRPQSTTGLTSSTVHKPHEQTLSSSQPTTKDSKALVSSGNGFASDSFFGGDVFSAAPNQSKQNTSSSTFSTNSLPVSSANSFPVSSAVVPVTTGPQSQTKQNSLDSLQSVISMQPSGNQLQRAQPQVKQNQQMPIQSTSSFTSGVQGGAGNSSIQSQPPWPKMTQSDIQKYTKVFMEVDTDRDGMITGDQARNLFLSWRLPREVLKQVWDLSDQDNDSKLSQREFCAALYLMERYREGRPLPTVLPSSIMFDETLQPTTYQPAAPYGNVPWGPSPGLPQPHGRHGVHPTPAAGGRPPIPTPAHPQADGLQSTPSKSRVPVLEKHLVNQLSNEEQSSLSSKFQEASEADKKVGELEKEILDSKEKIEYYRSKMQELVLYKSRCDNRLNEITERAIADKKEAESLAKKYEEKYKQVGDIASKLTIEEATFRDIQERKMELYNAIVKMEQGGSADGILQVRADRIQADLEELVKGLSERCKKYGLKVKPTALVELPFGWQPGIQEGAADWDEDWDKFEDEGFTFVKDLTVDVQNVIAPRKEKTVTVRKEKPSVDEDLPSSTVEGDKPSNTSERVQESGSTHAHSEDESARSPPGSPAGISTLESPSHDFRDNHFGKNFDSDSLFHTKESHSDDHGVAESTISGDNNFDEPTWGTFDDNESVWGTKDTDHEKDRDNSFFGSNDFGLDPIRTDSPQADSFFEHRSPFNFPDSVPASPLFNSNSPLRFDEGREHPFDNNSRFVSRFDSFNTSESGFGGIYSQPDHLARFDSMRSTSEQPDRLARFDSMRSTSEHPFQSFDDNDPFGSTGPFSTTSETPRRASDKWSAF